MPRQSAISTAATARRARQLLTGVGIQREDSDDELGDEDLTWEWIYNSNSKRQRIVGAQFGKFRCKIGDCVLLKAEGVKEAWVAMICEFEEDEDGNKAANFMWFSSEREIRNKNKKIMEVLANELYITPSFDINPLESINGSAKVLSPAAFEKKYPTGKISPRSKEYGKVFICRRGCDTRTSTYTDQFIWEDVCHGAENLNKFIDIIQSGTTSTRKNKRKFKEIDADVIHEDVEHEAEPRTPRKKEKTKAITPTSNRSKSILKTPSKLLTPSHKRIFVKKPLEFTPLGTRVLSPSHTSSPFQLARMRLHVSMVPPSLPCREEAFSQVYSHLESAITDGSGSCIYVSGTPGTGKTATVREAVSQLHAAVQAEELDDFIFVEINGMKVTDPHQSYSMLWEALQGDRVSPSHALDLLEREFTNPSPRRVPCVVLMDELDQLVTKNQSVMYNFFNWPSLRHSRLIVLAVANTMDLPERTLSNKISSRLGLTRITFPGYTHDQLMKIIQSRLEGVPENLVDPDAIQFASRKVAAVSGDARRALDICRRAVEIAESESVLQNDEPSTPSGRKQEADKLAQKKKTGRVIINTIKQAINEATSNPLQHCLKALPLASKVFLAALVARTRRSGISEAPLTGVIEDAKHLCQMSTEPAIKDSLLSREVLRPLEKEFDLSLAFPAVRVYAMNSSAIELGEAGIIKVDARNGDRIGKVRLNISEDEVKLALRDDPQVKSLGFA